MTELIKIEVGFAMFLPAMLLPVWGIPCENRAQFEPMQAPGVMPTPPVIPAAMWEIMVPQRLGATMTSNCAGFLTSCIEQLSTIISSYFKKGYFLAVYLAHQRKRPSTNFMMLALWITVIFLRRLKCANSKAYFINLSELYFVVTLRDYITPGQTQCSIPENSPSVFSRTTARSTLLCLLVTEGKEQQRLTLAQRSRCLQNLWLSLYLGRTPFSGTMTPNKIHLFRFRSSLFCTSQKMKSFMTSNLTGTFAASKTSKTEPRLIQKLRVISGPIPIPGIRVTV